MPLRVLDRCARAVADVSTGEPRDRAQRLRVLPGLPSCGYVSARFAVRLWPLHIGNQTKRGESGRLNQGRTMQTEQTPSEHDYRGIPARALQTRRAQFLAEADRLFPWQAWADMIEPHYPKRGKGRPPYPLPALLRLYLLQQWFNLSDLAAQEIATDSVAVRHFMALPLTWDKTAPDESTLLHFRRLLTRHGLAVQIAADASAALACQGWKLRPGELAEAWLLAVRP